MTYEEAIVQIEEMDSSFIDGNEVKLNFILPSISSDRSIYIASLKGTKGNNIPDVKDYSSNDDYIIGSVLYKFIYE